MYKKTITYTDYNGVERTEDFWFNLSKAELVEMEMSTAGGLTDMVEKIVKTQDMPSIIKIFKKMILQAYGEKSPDGKRFMKEDADGRPLYPKFRDTEAYSIMFMELATDADKAAEFINGIIPPDARDAAKGALPTM